MAETQQVSIHSNTLREGSTDQYAPRRRNCLRNTQRPPPLPTRPHQPLSRLEIPPRSPRKHLRHPRRLARRRNLHNPPRPSPQPTHPLPTTPLRRSGSLHPHRRCHGLALPHRQRSGPTRSECVDYGYWRWSCPLRAAVCGRPWRECLCYEWK